jgi:hypothetical protein
MDALSFISKIVSGTARVGAAFALVAVMTYTGQRMGVQCVDTSTQRPDPGLGSDFPPTGPGLVMG